MILEKYCARRSLWVGGTLSVLLLGCTVDLNDEKSGRDFDNNERDGGAATDVDSNTDTESGTTSSESVTDVLGGTDTEAVVEADASPDVGTESTTELGGPQGSDGDMGTNTSSDAVFPSDTNSDTIDDSPSDSETESVETASDSGTHTETVESSETGEVTTDSVVPTDTGTVSDTQDTTQTAQFPTDTAVPTDTILSTDTAVSTDTTVRTDTGVSTDTAVPTDTTVPTDTIVNTDTAVPTDTTVPTDTIVNTEVNTDTAVPTDTAVGECTTTYAGALVCSGFENGITLPLDDDNEGTISQSSDEAYDGMASAHVALEDNGRYAIMQGFFDPMDDGVLYYRGHFFIPSGLLSADNALIKLIDIRGSAANIDISVRGDGGVQVVTRGTGTTKEISDPGYAPQGVWFCMNGSVTLGDGTDGTVTVHIDGAEAITVAGVDTLPSDGISMVGFGIGWIEQISTAEVYIDNIVVDTVPIPCI